MANECGAWQNDADGRKLKYLREKPVHCHSVPLAVHDNRPATTTTAVVWPVSCSRKTLLHSHPTSLFPSTAVKYHLI